MKRSYELIGAVLGLLSSLILMAISYLGNTLAGFPFIPFDLFDWMARHLPGELIDSNIRLLITVINTLHLGPTAAIAKLIEQVQAIGIIVMIGLAFGLILGYIRARRRTDLIWASLAGGIILWLGLVMVELSLARPVAGLLEGGLWLLVLLGGWAWLLARGLIGQGMMMETRALSTVDGEGLPETIVAGKKPEKTTITNDQPITRRSWLLVLSGSLVSLMVLILGLRKFSQQAGQNPDAQKSLPDGSAQGRGASSGSNTAVPTRENNNLVQSFNYGPDITSGPAASPSTAILSKRIDPAPDTRAEITSVDQFYRIDINTRPTNVDADTWRLTVKGLVRNPLNLSLGDIQIYPRVTQAVTMECISNLVGGDLISTNFWTGIRLKDVLKKAELMPGVQEIAMTAGDGYYESLPIAEAMDDRTLLVYAMNGQGLTPEHGFPLRVNIPGHYGMKMPKWLTVLNAIDHSAVGYWAERGWTQTAIVDTTSVIDNITVDKLKIGPDGTVPLGGIAWAGNRGISKVEVQINSEPWVAAELRAPPISLLTWVQWRYDWKASPGTYQVQVRATDGAGVPQETRGVDPQPAGATGLYGVQIKI